jgi:hypothetical protein
VPEWVEIMAQPTSLSEMCPSSPSLCVTSRHEEALLLVFGDEKALFKEMQRRTGMTR